MTGEADVLALMHVLALVKEARERCPERWLGVNLLGRSPADALVTALDACDGRIDGI